MSRDMCPLSHELRHLRARRAKSSVTMIKPSCSGGGIRAMSLHSSLLLRAWRGAPARCASAALACGRSAYRSGSIPCRGARCGAPFAFHGCAEEAELHRNELAAGWAEQRAIRRAAPFLTVGELLEPWLSAHHDWRPATWISARSNARSGSLRVLRWAEAPPGEPDERNPLGPGPPEPRPRSRRPSGRQPAARS